MRHQSTIHKSITVEFSRANQLSREEIKKTTLINYLAIEVMGFQICFSKVLDNLRPV